jgi:transcription factor E2F6
MNYKRDRRTKSIKTETVDPNSSEEDYDDSEDDISIGEKKKSRQRVENSLGELTKNFINYIREHSNKEININDLVKKLKVKKRRIYDITNVLEGIIHPI